MAPSDLLEEFTIQELKETVFRDRVRSLSGGLDNAIKHARGYILAKQIKDTKSVRLIRSRTGEVVWPD